jgi:hypothetical protein
MDDAYWAAVRESVHDVLALDGNAHLAALGDEYVEAMKSGARLRELAEAEPSVVAKTVRIFVNPLFEAADRELNKPRKATGDVFAGTARQRGLPRRREVGNAVGNTSHGRAGKRPDRRSPENGLNAGDTPNPGKRRQRGRVTHNR